MICDRVRWKKGIKKQILLKPFAESIYQSWGGGRDDGRLLSLFQFLVNNMVTCGQKFWWIWETKN
jgi:hypothetical protein